MKQPLTTASLLPVALLAGLNTATAMASEPATSALDTVIVTGNRSAEKRTVTTSPVPIDVISAKQLQETGKPGLMEALSATVPSLTLPEKTGWDASGMARAPSLRGLNAAQVLVLVNGKRRHTSATLNISGINAGAAPSDLDLIPISAIDHVEVLRDGAAAQYGSDAIAGVINVILKADASRTAVTTAGQGYDGKKQTVQQSLNKGFEIGRDGILQLALDARSQNDDNKASANGYSQAEALDRAGKVTYGGYGTPKINLLTLGYNAELPVNDDLSLYSFSTWSYRKAEQGQNFRLPSIVNTITTGPNGYPAGYTPTWYIEEHDYQAAIGARGLVSEWDWDLSSTYGRNEAEQGTWNNQNPSLGEATPNHFESGTWVASQLTSNLDLRLGQLGRWGLLRQPRQLRRLRRTGHQRHLTSRGQQRQPQQLCRLPGCRLQPAGAVVLGRRSAVRTLRSRHRRHAQWQADHTLRTHPRAGPARHGQQRLPCPFFGQQPVQCPLDHLWRGERGVSVHQLRRAARGQRSRTSPGRRSAETGEIHPLQPRPDLAAQRAPGVHRRCVPDQRA
jgi:outer membrane receptor protein involved in Fe transport